MPKNYLKVCACAVLLALGAAVALAQNAAQETLPEPPADRSLIYVADGQGGALAALAFEPGSTPLRVEEVAKGDKRSHVELKGEHAQTIVTSLEPRFYLFLPDEANAKPPFLVRLTPRRGARRVTAMAQKGYKGFAIDSEEIVKPHYRVIRREGGTQFVEFRPRDPLFDGEYAIIGADLQRVATFRVMPAPAR